MYFYWQVAVKKRMTGTINSYNIDNAPLWIDHVVDLKIVENLASYNFKYKKGFINATIVSYR